MRYFLRVAILSLLALLVAGCGSLMNLVYKPTGWVVTDLADRHVVPYTMSIDDIGVACSTSQSLSPLVMSFSRVNSTPDATAIVLNIMSGNCAEEKGIEEGLSYIRELKAKNFDEAKDARIREKRMYAIAAKRLLASYNHMISEYGAPGTECPNINYDEGILWAMGNLAGIQAVYADLKAQSVVNVPKDIPQKAIRGLQCLDNLDYWGLPSAAQAGLWVLLPDSKPADLDPWVEMEAAGRVASDAGIRLAHLVEVLMADGTGDVARVKDAIRRHAASLEETSADRDYKLLDAIATMQIQAISDRMWTDATGSRTPIGGLGTFWDDKKEPELEFSIDDLLD